MRIKTKLLFVLTLLLLPSCTVRIKSREFEENCNEPLESYRFVEFERRYGYSDEIMLADFINGVSIGEYKIIIQ